MGFDWGSLANTLLGAGSLYLGYRGANQQGSIPAAVRQAGSTELMPWLFQGPGGLGAAVGGNQTQIDLGDVLGPLFGGFAGAAQSGLTQAGQTGLPQNVIDAITQRQSVSGGPAGQLGQLGVLEGLNFGNLTGANADVAALRGAGFQRGLQDTAFTGAQSQAAAAARGFPDVFQNVLSTLRQQAAPYEERAQNALAQRQFGTGQLGTTGGALQTEAFARGLGEADLSRQLQAFGESRAQQSQALQQAQGLAGVGSGIRGLEEDLLSSAFGRFGQTLQSAGAFNQERYNRGLQLNDLLYGRGQQNLENQIRLSGLPATLQGAFLQNALGGLGGTSTLLEQGLAGQSAALQAAQAQANARLGAGSLLTGYAGSGNYQPGATNNFLSDVLGGIVERVGVGGNPLDTLKRAFGFNSAGGEAAATALGSGAFAGAAPGLGAAGDISAGLLTGIGGTAPAASAALPAGWSNAELGLDIGPGASAAGATSTPLSVFSSALSGAGIGGGIAGGVAPFLTQDPMTIRNAGVLGTVGGGAAGALGAGALGAGVAGVAALPAAAFVTSLDSRDDRFLPTEQLSQLGISPTQFTNAAGRDVSGVQTSDAALYLGGSEDAKLNIKIGDSYVAVPSGLIAGNDFRLFGTRMGVRSRTGFNADYARQQTARIAEATGYTGDINSLYEQLLRLRQSFSTAR